MARELEFPVVESGTAADLGTGRLVLLDLARGLAALTVFLSHLRGSSFVEFGALPVDDRSPIVAALFALSRIGHEAVLIFFVLSGYLVGGSVLRRSVSGSFDVGAYAIDRTTRILIPLVPAVLFTVLIIYATSGEGSSLWVVFCNVFGLNGILAPTIARNAPLWSLAYEIWFYVLAGAVASIAARRGQNALLVSLQIAALLAATAVFSILDARYLLFWCVGSLAIFLDGHKQKVPLAWVGLLLAIAGVAAYHFGISSKSVTGFNFVPPAVAEAMICGGFAISIPALVAKSGTIGSGWFRRSCAALSDISYTLYLFHNPMLGGLAEILPKGAEINASTVALCVVKAVLALALTWFLFLAFEARTGQIRRAVKAWIASRRPPIIAKSS